MARQGMLKAPTFATLPVAETDQYAEASVVAITWAATPGASAAIEQLHITRTGKTINYVALRVGNITFRILDRLALDTAAKLLAQAHTLATVAFLDGPEHKARPDQCQMAPPRAGSAQPQNQPLAASAHLSDRLSTGPGAIHSLGPLPRSPHPGGITDAQHCPTSGTRTDTPESPFL